MCFDPLEGYKSPSYPVSQSKPDLDAVMEAILYTNSNEILTILAEHGVNVQPTHLTAQWESQDLVIFDERLIPPGECGDTYFTSRDLKRLRPEWEEWLLPRIRNQSCRPEYEHQCTLFYSGLHHYDVLYDKEKDRYDFERSWCKPEHFRQRDVLFTTDCLRHASRTKIEELLKIPRMARDIQQSLYYNVNLGCPLSLRVTSQCSTCFQRSIAGQRQHGTLIG